jgi:DNA-binding response OmpR family regulator
MLPKLDGIQLCQRLHQSGCQAYILLLTAKDATGDKVLGLDAGTDDYLVNPFEVDEITARLRALSRRQPIYQYQPQIEAKSLTLNLDIQPNLLVQGYIHSLDRVFINLIDNAIHYTPSGGNIKILARRIE